ncbi:hypothetical protein [Bradyrhizobium elkanii]|uniref:hypothetical protein n=1 Tax=Bradyrhizobium elkanii TaxID=29448 RepID=UPI00271466A1|nr:hypothetical protein [Bradyrhizobium elkanii]WLB04165.1 hypothetical protein QNJ80_20130 [Bradyrhizobium elkanii]
MKRAIILIAALLLAGCDEGNSNLPLPRLVCTQVTSTYSCGRGGTCEQCGNWEIGCPKPLELCEMTGSTGPYLACRLQRERSNASTVPPNASPVLQGRS